jgi:hypothetical protein
VLDDVQFDAFIGEKMQCPTASTFGGRRAGEFEQVGFGMTIKEGRCVGRGAFFAFECGFETFFDEAFADVGNGVGMAMKLLGDFAIGNASVFVFIDGEQNVGVFDLLGIAFAFGNQLGKIVTLFGGKGMPVRRVSFMPIRLTYSRRECRGMRTNTNALMSNTKS